MKRIFPESELIINADGSCFHLHVRPEQLADRIILVNDPASVDIVASLFDSKECEISSREFHTITGLYRNKRVTCLSYGYGSENIDIVINELDTMANIDYETRMEKDEHKTLTIVNIGTCEGIQQFTPVGSYVASIKAIGLDGLLNYYSGRKTICDNHMEEHFKEYLQWEPIKGSPYIVTSDSKLLQQIVNNDMITGLTISCIGFYTPQGRGLRLPLEDEKQNEKLSSYDYEDQKICNLDMESASIIGMASLLGHRAISCCLVESNRLYKSNSIALEGLFTNLYRIVLDRI